MQDFLYQLLSNPITVLAMALSIAGYLIISAIISGKWYLTNQKINSNTKKAKNLLKIGVIIWVVAFILFAAVIPFMSFRSESNEKKIKNPYLGDWIIEFSPIEEVPTSSRIRYFISDNNTVYADIKSTSGKELGYLRAIELNHYDYAKAEGKLSTNKGTRLDFKSSLRIDEQEIEILCFTKEGEEIGTMKIKK